MRYDDKELLREYYSILYMCQTGELHCSDTYVKKIKDRIRTILKVDEEMSRLYIRCYTDEDGHWIGDPDWCIERINIFHKTGNGCIKKYRLPARIKTKGKAEKFYKEFIHSTFSPTAYDCSNQEYTFLHVITHNMNENRFYVYEWVSYDV